LLDEAKFASELSRNTTANTQVPHVTTLNEKAGSHKPARDRTIAAATANIDTEAALPIRSFAGSSVY
jgi:hypothetical protein